MNKSTVSGTWFPDCKREKWYHVCHGVGCNKSGCALIMIHKRDLTNLETLGHYCTCNLTQNWCYIVSYKIDVILSATYGFMDYEAWRRHDCDLWRTKRSKGANSWIIIKQKLVGKSENVLIKLPLYFLHDNRKS